MIRHAVIFGALSIVILAAPAAAAETIEAPDFSGIWAHLSYPDVGPPVSGPGPVRNRSRVSSQFCGQPPCTAMAGSSPNGVSNIYQLIGDYTNPILKPEAAEVGNGTVKSRWLELPIRLPTTNVGQGVCRLCFGILECRCSSKGTRSPFFIPMTVRSATCA